MNSRPRALELCDGVDDVFGSESDVLNTGTAIEVDIFFDLGLLLTLGRLVDRHFDDVVGGRHNDTLEGREFTIHVSAVVRMRCTG